jgi:hypothetical protein
MSHVMRQGRHRRSFDGCQPDLGLEPHSHGCSIHAQAEGFHGARLRCCEALLGSPGAYSTRCLLLQDRAVRPDAHTPKAVWWERGWLAELALMHAVLPPLLLVGKGVGQAGVNHPTPEA